MFIIGGLGIFSVYFENKQIILVCCSWQICCHQNFRFCHNKNFRFWHNVSNLEFWFFFISNFLILYFIIKYKKMKRTINFSLLTDDDDVGMFQLSVKIMSFIQKKFLFFLVPWPWIKWFFWRGQLLKFFNTFSWLFVQHA